MDRKTVNGSDTAVSTKVVPQKRKSVRDNADWNSEIPKASIKDDTPLPILIPFGIVAYGFVGQPFSKQLYTLVIQ